MTYNTVLSEMNMIRKSWDGYSSIGSTGLTPITYVT